MTRVLIAEDSLTCLGVLTEIMRTDPHLTLLGHASNGRDAIRMARELRPDVIVMDVHMPIMDGFEATRQIMVDAPTPIVIVSATIDLRDVQTSMQALRVGALAILPKPNLVDVDASGFAEEAHKFCATIRAMAGVRVVQRWPARSRQSQPPISRSLPPTRVGIVAIAASTGGPGALHRVLCELPREFPAPIVVVQHIANGFVAGMAAWLDAAASLGVKVAEHGETLQPGTVYIAPDDQHLGLLDPQRIALSSAPPVGGFRPSATFMFDAIARHHGPRAVGVILTGMGEDGVAGLRPLRAAGGRVLAQDEESSVVFGMPGAAIASGLADNVVPLHMLAQRLRRWVDEGCSGAEGIRP